MPHIDNRNPAPEEEQYYTITEKGIGFIEGFKAAFDSIRVCKTIEEFRAWIAAYDEALNQ